MNPTTSPIRWLCAILAALWCVATAPAYAADSASATPRPKIGLALGGGGARGLAHIGVLKVLEEMHVPIDYIAGTSAGAIIGGMYASGASPLEIETRITNLNWEDILSDKLARQELSYRRKLDDRTYLLPLELGVRDFKFIFPRGLIAGQKIGFFLRSATLRAAGVSNFDRLPIPFRAIATDIENGQAVVLGQGDLAEAMRASMAVPGIFSPVEIGGRLLVDGGMSANVPVEAVRAMGADIIIAVNISAPLLNRKQIETIVDISDQTLSLLSQKTNEQQLTQLRRGDVLMNADLGAIATTEFDRAAEIIERGAQAARAQADTLKALTQPDAEYDDYLHHQRNIPEHTPRVDFVRIKRPKRVARDVITQRVETHAGDELDLDRLRDDMARIYDLADFERVDFRTVTDGEREGLEIETHEKSWGPNYAHFGLSLIDDFEGESRFNILVNYTRTWVNLLGGEWKTDASIGHNRKIATEFYQPLDVSSIWFLAPHAQYSYDTRDIYDGDDRVAQYSTKLAEVGIDGGLQLGKHGEVRVGAVRDWVSAAPRIGPVDLPAYNIKQGAYVASVVYDQIDNIVFPRQGILASAHLFMARAHLGSDATYDKLDVNWLNAFTYDTHTMFAGLHVGTNIRNSLPVYDEFTLGGFQQLSGYRTAQLSGQYLAFGRLVYHKPIARLSKTLGTTVHVGASLEAGNVWESREEVTFGNLRKSFSIFTSADTVLGPVHLAYGHADSSHYAFYLFLGNTF